MPKSPQRPSTNQGSNPKGSLPQGGLKASKWSCRVCGMYYDRKAGRDKHMQRHHPGPIEVDLTADPDTEEESDDAVVAMTPSEGSHQSNVEAQPPAPSSPQRKTGPAGSSKKPCEIPRYPAKEIAYRLLRDGAPRRLGEIPFDPMVLDKYLSDAGRGRPGPPHINPGRSAPGDEHHRHEAWTGLSNDLESMEVDVDSVPRKELSNSAGQHPLTRPTWAAFSPAPQVGPFIQSGPNGDRAGPSTILSGITRKSPIPSGISSRLTPLKTTGRKAPTDPDAETSRFRAAFEKEVRLSTAQADQDELASSCTARSGVSLGLPVNRPNGMAVDGMLRHGDGQRYKIAAGLMPDMASTITVEGDTAPEVAHRGNAHPSAIKISSPPGNTEGEMQWQAGAGMGSGGIGLAAQHSSCGTSSRPSRDIQLNFPSDSRSSANSLDEQGQGLFGPQSVRQREHTPSDGTERFLDDDVAPSPSAYQDLFNTKSEQSLDQLWGTLNDVVDRHMDKIRTNYRQIEAQKVDLEDRDRSLRKAEASMGQIRLALEQREARFERQAKEFAGAQWVAEANKKLADMEQTHRSAELSERQHAVARREKELEEREKQAKALKAGPTGSSQQASGA